MNILETLLAFKEHISKKLLLFCIFVAMITFLLKAKTIDIHSSIVFSVLFLIFILVTLFIKEEDFEIKQKRWINEIIMSMRNVRHATIYLKDFLHPDDERIIDKDQILKLMKIISKLIIDNSDNIKIFVYRPRSEQSQNPIDWLISELGNYNIATDRAILMINKCIKVLQKEPLLNTCTFYLLNKRLLLYTYSDNGKIRYFKISLFNSIIPHLINEGCIKALSATRENCHE